MKVLLAAFFHATDWQLRNEKLRETFQTRLLEPEIQRHGLILECELPGTTARRSS